MARPQHLFVFAYDVARDSDRVRLAELIGERADRVQKSVFEGRMTLAAARRLAETAAILLGPDDSLRVYCIPEEARRVSIAIGGAPISEAGEFWLL